MSHIYIYTDTVPELKCSLLTNPALQGVECAPVDPTPRHLTMIPDDGIFSNHVLIAKARDYLVEYQGCRKWELIQWGNAFVLTLVERHYPGGLAQFIRDNDSRKEEAS